MKLLKKVSISIVVAIMVLIASYFIYEVLTSHEYVDNNMLDSLELSNVNKVMIVAHPDDETIWGGAHLLKDDYLVICITNGNNDVRKEEYKNALEYSKDPFIILPYSDKKFFFRSRWLVEKQYIEKDIKTILSYKNWEQIITHNPEGEYGHNHHKMINDIVTKIACQLGKEKQLWYFGKYYTKDELVQVEEQLQKNSEDIQLQKEQMWRCYPSQNNIINKKFGHMLLYENWYLYVKQ